MDDLWANAWGESTKPTGPHTTTISWSSSLQTSNTVNEDQEADIATPSWATGAEVQWTEPLDSQTSIWNNSLSTKGWDTSHYDSIPIGKALHEISSPPPSLSLDIVVRNSPQPPALPVSSPPELPISPSLSDGATIHSLTSPVSAPGSPDGFGTFETGPYVEAVDTDPWSPSNPAFGSVSADADAWDSAWGAPESEQAVESNSKSFDKWEAAKQQKEKQDRYVPPEVFASILRQFEELSNELWPSNLRDPNQNRTYNGSDSRGLDGVEGLTAIIDKLIPQDLTLPPNIPFSKSFSSKHMIEALRLTRHVALTRMSPMALYLASKGSTAWEASVKSKSEVKQDDMFPPGWRVVGKVKEEPSPTLDGKKKTSGGLLSFFARGTATPFTEASPRRSESPVRASSRAAGSGAVSGGSPRASMDSTKLSPALSNTLAATSLPITTNLPVPPDLTATIAAQSSVSRSEIFHEPTPQPSAISRFLDRFSRNKSSGTSPHNSIALSSDDIEFLSDIVPSANDEVDDVSQLKDLSTMVNSSPSPTKLPALLAPPPRPPPPTTITSNSINSNLNPTSQSAILNVNENFLSLFDPPSTTVKPAMTPAQASNSSSLISPFPASSLTRPQPSTKTPAPILTHFRIGSPPPSCSTSTPAQSQSLSSSEFPLPSTSRANTSNILPKRTPTVVTSTSHISTTAKQNAFILPPPPSFAFQPPVILPPNKTPTTQKHLPDPPSTPQHSSKMHFTQTLIIETPEDDDFTEFHSSPSQGVAPRTFFESPISSSDQRLFPASSNTIVNTPNQNNLFDNLVSSLPSPPPPPAKPTPFSYRSSSPHAQGGPSTVRETSPPKQKPRKISRAADHQRTLSLVETAAARRGIWPAPPSPLPEAIPPPGAPGPASFDFGTFDGGLTIQNQQSIAMTGLVPSASSPAAFSHQGDHKTTVETPTLPPPPLNPTRFPSPPVRTLSPSNLVKQNGSTWPPALTTIPTPPTSAANGALSAQDLSFFEGL